MSDPSPLHAPGLLFVGVALGSNLGNRREEIAAGFDFLASLATDGRARRSRIIETLPVDCPPGSAPFLNAVAEITIDPRRFSPEQLHARLKGFELSRGRDPGSARHAPRPLDLDLLYFGDQVVATPALTVPHPRLAARPFVLGPLAELRPELVLPGESRTVRELLQDGAATAPGVE